MRGNTSAPRAGALNWALCVLLASIPASIATVIEVDGSTCDLASAIAAANGDTPQGGCPAGSGTDVILLQTDVTLDSVDNVTDGANGLPSITEDLTLRGDGAPLRSIVRSPEAPAFRLLHVGDGVAVTLERLSLRNGDAAGNRGGAVYNGGRLTVLDSLVAGNSALLGGAISSASAFGPATWVTIADSTLENNTTGGVGGALFLSAGYEGEVRATLLGSTLAGNTAAAGGAILATSYGSLELVLVNSTLSGNQATDRGGAIYAHTYGMLDLTLSHSTLAGNGATTAGSAIYNRYANIDVHGSAIGHPAGAAHCGGKTPIASQAASLADDTSCGPVPSGLAGLDPVRASSGGLTATHALLDGSTAIDHAGACGLAADQRGFARDAACDAGAFEHGAKAPFGGGLTGARGRRVRCVNLTTGQSVDIALGGEPSWSCEKAGLVVGPGDRVRAIVTGDVP